MSEPQPQPGPDNYRDCYRSIEELRDSIPGPSKRFAELLRARPEVATRAADLLVQLLRVVSRVAIDHAAYGMHRVADGWQLVDTGVYARALEEALCEADEAK